MNDDSDYLRKIKRNQDVANLASAASLVQQRLLINDVRDLKAELAAFRTEERAYRFAMWLQSPDGNAYSQWRTEAMKLITEFERRDRLWKHAWDKEVADRISTRERDAVASDRYTETPRWVAFQYRVRYIVLAVIAVALFAAIGSYNNGAIGPYMGFSVMLAGGAGLLAWVALYRDRGFIANEQSARQHLADRRRTHFGVDPLDPSQNMPSWSRDAQHVRLFEHVKGTLVSADLAFPTPDQLPRLEMPAVVESDTVALSSHKELLRTEFNSDPGGSTDSMLAG